MTLVRGLELPARGIALRFRIRATPCIPDRLGKSPIGNPFDYFGPLDKHTRAFVQKVADETVRKFFAR